MTYVEINPSGRNRLSPELAITCGVNMFVDTAAGNVRSIVEIVEQVLFTRMQDFKLDVLPEVRAVDQKFEAAPRGFKLLERGFMQNGIHLLAEDPIQLGNHLVDAVFVDQLIWVIVF